MTLLKLNELKKELKEFDQKEMIQLISELYKLNNDVQQYLSNKSLEGRKLFKNYICKKKRK
jgi:hypothetical protein